MSFIGYKDADDMLQKTGKTPQECLAIIDAELDRIRNERDKVDKMIPKKKDRYDDMPLEELMAEAKRRGIL